MERIDIIVNQVPTSVSFECPDCCWETEIQWKEFMVGREDYPGDWLDVQCEECKKEFKIDNIEW